MFWGESGVVFLGYFGRDLTEFEGVEEFSSAELKVEYMFSQSQEGGCYLGPVALMLDIEHYV